MNIIVCIDDDFGMMFNNRRQSRDRAVCENVLKLALGNRVLMNSYSATLFQDFKDLISVDDDCILNAQSGDYCFIENSCLPQSAERVIIYRWNRKYPSDKKFDVGLIKDKRLVGVEEFKGNSHDKITREIYE